jgi:hypothetical protein
MNGHCLCGNLSYSIDADPVTTVVCHCQHCQHQSGSAFSINVLVPRAAFNIEGETKSFTTIGEDTGSEVERVFCPNCGSPIASLAAYMPELALIKAGTLEDSTNLNPVMDVWCDSAHDWVDIPEARRQFARDYVAS